MSIHLLKHELFIHVVHCMFAVHFIHFSDLYVLCSNVEFRNKSLNLKRLIGLHSSPETCMALLSSMLAAVQPCVSRQRKREKYPPARTVKGLILRGGSLITFSFPITSY